MKMEFCFLGGADSVGRMGMTMTTPSGDNMLIEYGMAPTKPPEYPLQAPRIKHAFLTHSHLDHCGMIPAICGSNCVPLHLSISPRTLSCAITSR